MNPSAEAKGTCEIQLGKKDKLRNQLPVADKLALNTGSIDGPYAKYVLMVLTLVFVFNAVDRGIFSILAEDIKSDLNLSDAQLGFLAGAAFSVFYATFGMVLSRLADVWNRKKLITIGLGFWSAMTTLSGMAKAFLPLAVCRFGVAAGESSATPAAYSILYDYFSPRLRTTALSLYSAGGIVGAALSLFIGGLILDSWGTAYPDTGLAPFGLKGWQAAFIIVGLPGLLMALWLSTLREPVRGQSDGVFSPPHPTPFRETGMVLISMLPLLNLWYFARHGGGRRAVAINLAAGGVIAIVAGGLIYLTENVAQWLAMGIGLLAAVSWVQSLALRDPVIFGLIFRCKTYLFLFVHSLTFGVGMTIAFFWAVPYFQRYFAVSATEVGAVMGVANAVSGFAGMLMGGLIADKLRARNQRGKLHVVLAAVGMMMFSIFLFATTKHLVVAYAGIIIAQRSIGLGSGPAVSTVNDLMLPRGRATVSAFFFMVGYLVIGSLAPYLIGQISDVFVATGLSSGESLRRAMLWCFVPASVLNLFIIILAMRFIGADEDSLLDRARALGENV